jgi:hypothetical protein
VSQWTSPGRIVTGLVSVALLVALGASMSGSQRAQSLGLTQHGALITAQDAGAADAVATVAVSPGTAGQVLTVSDAGLPHWAAAATSSVTTTTYYADDGTAANGAGVDATASVSGVDDESRLTLGVSSTSRLQNSSGFAAGRWTSPTIPRSARRVVLYVRSTALIAFTTGGFRYLQMSLARAAQSPPTDLLFGAVVTDNNSVCTCGNMRSNSNAASYTGLATTNGSPLLGTDRWVRVTWEIENGGPRVRFEHGATTGTTRPTAWTAINVDTQTQATTTTLVGSMGTSDLVVHVALESYGQSAVSSATLALTMEVET